MTEVRLSSTESVSGLVKLAQNAWSGPSIVSRQVVGRWSDLFSVISSSMSSEGRV